MSRRGGRIIFVGNLPGDVRKREVEDLFYKYGSIVDVDLKIPPRPPAYAYVEFEDPRDAEDAIRGRDGYKFDSERLRTCRALMVKKFGTDKASLLQLNFENTTCRNKNHPLRNIGLKICVELAHFGRGGPSSHDRPSSHSGGSRRGAVPRRSEYREFLWQWKQAFSLT